MYYSCVIVALRKLVEKRKNVEGRKEKRDIIRDYTSFDSQVYAPMTRIGVYLDAGADQYSIKSPYNTTLQGTCQFCCAYTVLACVVLFLYLQEFNS